MLQYLWIPAAVVVGVFILALCFHFYSEYNCCRCCKKSSPHRPTAHDDVELGTVISVRSPYIDDGDRLAPSAPEDELLRFKFGDREPSDIYSVRSGIPTLDLHGLTAEEARTVTRRFLSEECAKAGGLATGGAFMPGNLATGRNSGKTVRIITGRGLHSQGGIPVVKPVVENILRQRQLKFEITAKGGAFLVHL